MTKRDLAQLDTYVREIADLMGLRDWELDIVPEPTVASDEDAGCHPVYGQQYARIDFCADFREKTAPEQRRVVVHELLHCHLAQLQECFEARALQEQLGRPLMTMFESRCGLALEYVVDSISRAWAGKLPVIKWD